MSNVKLYDVIRSGYAFKNNGSQPLINQGYVLDKDLSSDNHQTYFNQKENKLIYNVVGSHNMNDFLVTDVMLAAGKLKNSKRYKEDDKILQKSKEKYNVKSAVITGHSLGASVGRLIASNDDQVFGLDGGYTIGQSPIKSNDHEFRTKGDVVSILAPKKGMVTLPNPKKRNLLSYLGFGFNPIKSALDAHDVENIKNSDIFV